MLRITYAENTGGAFSVGQEKTIQIIISNIIIIGIVIRFLFIQFEKMDNITKIILSMVLSGGISNLLDRLLRGFVVDYLDITQFLKFPIFNLADVYVVIGWIMLVVITVKYTFRDEKHTKELPVKKEG